jgi:CHASE2 domain-containing sensor protein
MTITTVIAMIFGNLGATPPQVITLLTVLGCLLIMAKDFRLGIMFLMLFSSLIFMGAYFFSYDTTIPLVTLLVSFALLSITYLLTYKKSQSPFEAV